MSPETGVDAAGGDSVRRGDVGRLVGEIGDTSWLVAAVIVSSGTACGSDTRTIGTSDVGDVTRVVGDATAGTSTASIGPEGKGECSGDAA